MNQDQFQPQPQLQQDQPYPQVPPPMQKPSLLKRYALFGVAAVLLAGAGVFTYLGFKGPDTQQAAVVKVDDTANQVEDVDSPEVASSRTAVIELTAASPVPNSLTVTPGTSVVWKNMDTKAHVLTSEVLGGDNTVDAGASYAYIFDQPGDYTVKDGQAEITVMVKE